MHALSRLPIWAVIWAASRVWQTVVLPYQRQQSRYQGWLSAWRQHMAQISTGTPVRPCGVLAKTSLCFNV